MLLAVELLDARALDLRFALARRKASIIMNISI